MEYPLKREKSLDSAKLELELLEKAVQAFDVLNITDDVDMSAVTESDFRNLRLLITAFVDNEPVYNLRKDLAFDFVISIGGLRIALIRTIEKNCENAYRVHDYFSDRILFGYTLDDEFGERKHYVPAYSNLDAPAWGAISNVNYEYVCPAFKKLYEQYNDTHIFPVANNTMLSLLLAYDSTQKSQLLATARELSDWLSRECTTDMLHNDILTINSFQVARRWRDLDKKERDRLQEIAEDSTAEIRFRVGANLLLGNQEAAEFHFKNMGSDMQEDFRKWPIYHFWMDKNEG
jgi:hypothetical protein